MHDDSDCSSAEEERRHRQHHASSSSSSTAAAAATSAASSVPRISVSAPEKKQKNNEGMASPPPLMSITDLVQMQEMPYHLIPKMKSLSELLKDAPHLTISPLDGSPICQDAKDKIASGQAGKRKEPSPETPGLEAAAAAAMMFDEKERALSSPGTEDLTKALAAARIAQRPDLNGHWVKTEFKRRLEELPVNTFFEPGNPNKSDIKQRELQDELRKGRNSLPVQSATLESHLMAEAGTFVRKDDPTKEMYFPPCRNGDRCIGMTSLLRCQKRHCVFMMILFEGEYRYLVNSGRPPPREIQRPCVMCYRHSLTEAVLFARHLRMRGETQPGVKSSVLPVRAIPTVPQFYCNLQNREGGYHKKHMLETNHDPDDPILEPICMPARLQLVCVESEKLVHKGEGGLPRIVIDQQSIVWKAPPKPIPSIGQNLLNFCGGASNY